MKSTTRRLALTMATLAWLATPWIAHANVFGTGNNGVYAEQQRFEKDKSEGKGKSDDNGKSDDKGWQGGSSYLPPHSSYETPTNQVPEPQTLGLVAIGLLAAWAASRRRKD